MRLALCALREESLILSESAGRGRVSSSLCPQGMQAYPLCHCSSCNSVWADLAFNVACLFSNYFSDYFPFFSCIHHSYCHVMCQILCTCYQLVIMAHNVMLSVPSLAAGCQGVLRGETPQLEYGH